MPDNVHQHVSPCFLIANFADAADWQGRVHVRVKQRPEVSLKAPSGQGYEDDAFTVWHGEERDTSCDKANQAIETFCAPRLKRLAADRPPTDDEWRAVFFITANLLSRSRWTRDHQAWQLERPRPLLPGLAELVGQLPPLPPPFEAFDISADEVTEMSDHLQRAIQVQYPFMVARGVQSIAEDLKTGKDCDLLTAPPGAAFISSDEPAVVLENGKAVISTWQQGFLARPEFEVFVALNPGLACVWSRNSRRTSRSLGDPEVRRFNLATWESCYERAFASRKSDLEVLP